MGCIKLVAVVVAVTIFANVEALRRRKNSTALVLYTSPRCPFGRRALIAMKEKNLTHQLVYIPLSGELRRVTGDPTEPLPPVFAGRGLTAADLTGIKEDYKRNINAKGEVPSLIVDAAIVTEAGVLAEFLEDAFPASGTSLMPKDAVQRSRIRHYLKILGGSGGVSGFYGLLKNQDPAKDQEFLDKVYGHWELFAQMAGSDGPFFLGKSFSLADVLLMPMYDQFRGVWPHWRGAELIPSDPEAFLWVPRVQAWAAAVQKRESFTSFSQGDDTYVRIYESYAGDRGASEFGK